MFNIRNLRTMLAVPDPREEETPFGIQAIEQLRNRVAELEEQNANLRRLDDTIRKNARLFGILLERCLEGIGLLTADLIVLRLIHSTAGYEETDVSGQPFLAFIHPDDAGSFQRSFSQLLAAQAKSVSCEFRFRRKDGSWVWLACEMTDMLDDPDVQAILLNVRNITEGRAHAAAAQRLKAYSACSEYAMFSKDLNGVILDWNPGAQKVFGYSPVEIIGQNVQLLLRPNLLSKELSTREKILRGEQVPAFQTTRVTKDGRDVEISLKLAPVWDGYGTVTAITHLSRLIHCLTAPPD